MCVLSCIQFIVPYPLSFFGGGVYCQKKWPNDWLLCDDSQCMCCHAHDDCSVFNVVVFWGGGSVVRKRIQTIDLRVMIFEVCVVMYRMTVPYNLSEKVLT